MIALPSSVRILLWRDPIDLRRGFDGLAALVQSAGEDVYSGHLYCFASRRRNRLKVLTWQRSGFLMVYKRLSRGYFQLPQADEERIVLDPAQLALLLDGADVTQIKRPAVWTPPVRNKRIDTAHTM